MLMIHLLFDVFRFDFIRYASKKYISIFLDGANGQFRFSGKAELAHEHDIQFPAQHIGDDLGHRDGSARNRENQRVLSLVASAQFSRQQMCSVFSVFESHGFRTSLDSRRLAHAYVRGLPDGIGGRDLDHISNHDLLKFHPTAASFCPTNLLTRPLTEIIPTRFSPSTTGRELMRLK